MLEANQIDAIAAEVGKTFLPPDAVVQARSRPDIGPDGEQQLWVMFIIKDKSIEDINGENALNTIDELQQRLQARGEDRFAVVEFASETEFAADGGA